MANMNRSIALAPKSLRPWHLARSRRNGSQIFPNDLGDFSSLTSLLVVCRHGNQCAAWHLTHVKKCLKATMRGIPGLSPPIETVIQCAS